jgi:hypothetical protein
MRSALTSNDSLHHFVSALERDRLLAADNFHLALSLTSA